MRFVDSVQLDLGIDSERNKRREVVDNAQLIATDADGAGEAVVRELAPSVHKSRPTVLGI